MMWVSLVFVRIMYAFEVTKYEAMARTIERSWAFFVGGAVLWYFKGLSPFVVALLVGYTLRELLRIRWGQKFFKGKVEILFQPSVWKELLKKSYPFWLIGLFTLIYYRTDMVMLSLMRGDYETGIYRAAYTLIEVSLFVPSIVVSTTMPSMARLHKEDRKTLEVLFKKSFRALLLLGLFGTVGYYIFARLGILIVFGGGDFLRSIPVLKVLSFAIPFMFLNSLFGSFFKRNGGEGARVYEDNRVYGVT